jgi:hypothetical protein
LIELKKLNKTDTINPGKPFSNNIKRAVNNFQTDYNNNNPKQKIANNGDVDTFTWVALLEKTESNINWQTVCKTAKKK